MPLNSAVKTEIVRRLGGSAADQIFTSLTSLALTALCARNTSAAEFGLFSTGVSIVLSVQAFARATGTEAVAITALESRESRRVQEAAGTGASLLLALIAALSCVVGALVFPGWRMIATSLSVCLMGVVYADCRRGLYLSSRRQRNALTQSSYVLITTVTAAALCVATQAKAWAFLMAWGLASGLSSVLAGRHDLSIRWPVSWIRSHKNSIRWLIIEALSQSVLNQVAFLVIAAVLSPADLGAIRGALLLFAPLTLFSQGLALIIPAEARREPLPLVRLAVDRLLLTIMILVAIAVAALRTGPVWHLASYFLGATAFGAEGILVPIGVFVAGSSMTMVASLALRGAAGAAASGRMRATLAPLCALCSIGVAAATQDVYSVAWSLGLAQFLLSLVWWARFRRFARSARD